MRAAFDRPWLFAALLGLASSLVGCDTTSSSDGSIVPHLVPRALLLQELHELEGQDLIHPDLRPRVRTILGQLGVEVPTEEHAPTGLMPWFVWRISDSDGVPVTVLVMWQRMRSIPGQSRLRFVVWDEHATQISQQPDFNAGWRLDAHSVRLVHDPEGRDLIEVVMAGWREPAEADVPLLPRWYFAIIDGEAAVVRLEEQGKPRRNHYVWPNHTIGPPMPAVDRATCLATLSSPDTFEILELLIWLAGDHSEPFMPDEADPDYVEPEATRLLVEQLRNDPEILDALRNLRKTSTHPWVGEIALQALLPDSPI